MADTSRDLDNDDDMSSEDILGASLEMLYGYAPITHSSAGAAFTYTSPSSGHTIRLRTPDTQPANWVSRASPSALRCNGL
jgi:nicotinamide N-methyltransferase